MNRFALTALLALTVGLSACGKEKQLEEEARQEATKFWSTRVFHTCGKDGFVGHYFGKRGGKIYEFYSNVVVYRSEPSAANPYADEYEWYGHTYLFANRYRTFENGKWTGWKEFLEGFERDPGRDAIVSKLRGQWVFGYPEKPTETSFVPADCSEVAATNPPDIGPLEK